MAILQRAKLIWVTPDAEKLLVYMARVSSTNQNNPDQIKLIRYLIKNKHFSPFSMVNICFEVHTTIAISKQILRHYSIMPQELSARYTEAPGIEYTLPRAKGATNRQSSTDTLDNDTFLWFLINQNILFDMSTSLYKESMSKGVANECARFLLPQAAKTRMFLNGSLRSWIHYLEARDEEHAQLEHRQIAVEIKNILIKELPVVAEALGWYENQDKTAT